MSPDLKVRTLMGAATRDMLLAMQCSAKAREVTMEVVVNRFSGLGGTGRAVEGCLLAIDLLEEAKRLRNKTALRIQRAMKITTRDSK